MAVALQLEGVRKAFGTGIAVDGAAFDVEANEFVSIVGPSGCGKSTLLRLVAGLVAPTAGRIRVRGKDVDGPISDVGMVFQAPVLLPWRTTVDNILFVAEIGGRPAAAHRARAQELIEVGAVLLDGATSTPVAEFHAHARPTLHWVTIRAADLTCNGQGACIAAPSIPRCSAEG